MGYGDLWSVNLDVTIAIVLRHPDSCPYKSLNLVEKCCVCVVTALETTNSPAFLPLLRPPYSLRHNRMEIRLISNPQWSLSERKSCKFPTLHQKLEVTKLSEEGMSKASTG